MKKTSGWVIATFVICGAATSAHAVPVSIEYSGYVSSSYRFNSTGMATQDPTFLNQAFQASFLIETDGLVRTTSSTVAANSLRYSDVSTAPELITSTLTIGGAVYDTGAYAYDTGNIEFLDSNGPVSCGVGCTTTTPDQFVIRDLSSELPLYPYFPAAPPPVPGTYRSQSLFFSSTPGFDPLSPLPNTTYIDLTQDIDASSVALLELFTVGGGFSQYDYNCTNVCRNAGWLSLGFHVTSVSRSIQSVPEPSTLALLGIGAIGVMVGKRRSKR